MKASSLVMLVAAAPMAMASTGYRGYGFIGLGINMYKPTCASACRDTLSGYQLRCSTVYTDKTMEGHGIDGFGMRKTRKTKRMDGMGDVAMIMVETPPECYASDSIWLQSMAYCIRMHCGDDVTISELEHWWETYLVGRQPDQLMPVMPYSEARLGADLPPTAIINSDLLLDNTTLVDEDEWTANFNGDLYFERSETTHTNYGLVVFLTGVGIPVVFSWLRFIPFPKPLISQFNAAFVDPPLFGRSHREPVNIFLVPTRGQAFFIGYLILINVMLCAVGYEPAEPNSWFGSMQSQVVSYIGNRTGVLSLANLPLLVLYSSRNSFLIWLTSWSHSTFLMLHRWVATIATVEACLHSVIYLWSHSDAGDHGSESRLDYWIWGIVATLAMLILLPASLTPIRQKMYEVFLASHFVLALLALIGCYLHIYDRFGHQWGYETWVIFLALPIWAFDRLMRIARFARHGVVQARVTPIDNEYVRIDIPGVAAHGHAYLYFPTLTWRVWENHPFSVAGTMLLEPEGSKQNLGHESTAPVSVNLDLEHAVGESTADIEKQVISSKTTSIRALPDKDKDFPPPSASSSSSTIYESGSTFIVRTTAGMTGNLCRLPSSGSSTSLVLPVLIESSYPSHTHELDTVPNVIVIAGGVGISAVAPILRRRYGIGRTRLFWGVRSMSLVDAVEAALGKDLFRKPLLGCLAVGRRMNIQEILESEVPIDSESTVVVCGPQGMADEVRWVVGELANAGRVVTLVDEAFSW